MRILLLLLIFNTTSQIYAQTIAFGSCHKVNDPKSDLILTSIANQRPDAFVWLGDIVYGKDGNPKHLSKQFKKLKSKYSYQNLLQSTDVYGTGTTMIMALTMLDVTTNTKNEVEPIYLPF